MQNRPRRLLVLAGTFLAGAAAASVLVLGPGVGADDATPGTTSTTSPPTTTTATPTTLPPTTTTVAPTTTTTAAPGLDTGSDSGPDADGTLRPGDRGPEVQALQERLVSLGFWLGTPDAGYGKLTEQAVLAFQKSVGLGRDGIAGPGTQGALATAGRPTPRDPADGVEIDLARQLLLVVRGGQVEWAVNTSTGTDRTPTPLGDYVVQREIDGVRNAPLGRLYRPKYFHGGIAVHGSPSIPGYPASHGCARVSNPAMDHLWASGALEVGTPVRVH